MSKSCCWKDRHVPGCRPARPKCRWMRLVQRAKYGPCCCSAYHFPHRAGSGRCGHPERWEEEQRCTR